MSDTKTLRQKPSQVSLQMEEIQSMWPKHRAILDIEPQENRAALSDWIAWLPKEIDRELAKVRKLREQDIDAEYARLFELRELWSLMQLPEDVIIAARKRLFGEMPPVDKNGEYEFSDPELSIIAAAFWARSNHREDYAELVRKAERRAKRAEEVNRVFNDLRRELNS